MKKLFILLAATLVGILQTSCEYDDADIWNEMDSIKDRVETLEQAAIKTNEDIAALQAIINALQKNVYVADVENNANGYTIKFSDDTNATITNGKDGKNGTNAPIISVKMDTDGSYYWTMDGEWLLVDGEKVRANGIDGVNGEDAIAPQIRINGSTKEWEISTDGGETWVSTGVVAEGKDGADGEDGKDGLNGENGSTPVISIKKDTDGNYYWTLNGEWIIADGGKVRANGSDGGNGSNGIAPQIRINEETKEWEISTDGGLTWTSTGIVAEGQNGSNGQNGTNGDSFFKSVDLSNPDYVIITLADGNVFLLARYDENSPRFVIVNAPELVQVEHGKTVEFDIEARNVADYIINTPEGWKARYVEGKLSITAPAKDLCHFDKEGVVAISLVSDAGKSAIVKLNVMAGEWIEEVDIRTLTFEDADAKFESYYLDYVNNYEGKEIKSWSDLIDNPQYYGPLTYGNDQMDAMYTWWDEGNTELCHTFPYNYSYCYWGGGHAISNYWGEGFDDKDRDAHIAKYYGQGYVDQWVGQPGADAYLGWFNLQLMVPVAPHSGNNFVVHYGYKDFFNYIENLPEISFADGEARVIDHMYVTNTNYTLNQLINGVKSEEGNTFGGSWEGLNEDAWLKIVAYGFDDVDADAYAEPISEVEFYLVQGENVVTDWQKWDLTGLGKVSKVRFNFLYSEDMGGRYGFTIPGYFAYDDIAVQFGSKEVFK